MAFFFHPTALEICTSATDQKKTRPRYGNICINSQHHSIAIKPFRNVPEIFSSFSEVSNQLMRRPKLRFYCDFVSVNRILVIFICDLTYYA